MPPSTEKFLLFSLPDSLYALNLAAVAEIGDPPQMSPIPLAPSCYSGAASFHGDIVAVLDLSLFLGLLRQGRGEKIIVLDPGIASLAFLVDSVVRIVSSAEVLATSPPSSASCPSPATLSLPEGDAVQIDIEALIRAAETCMQQGPPTP